MTCCRCGREDAERRYSFGIYAGVYCDTCAKTTFKDHCGPVQGDPTELLEFEMGGWDAIYGEDV